MDSPTFSVWKENEKHDVRLQIREVKELMRRKDSAKKKGETIRPKEIRMAFLCHVEDYPIQSKLPSTKIDYENMKWLVENELVFDHISQLPDKELNLENFKRVFEQEFLKARNSFKEKYPNCKILTLFYFSGHGLYQRHPVCYLKRGELIEIEKLKFLLRGENSVNIFLLDCCESYLKFEDKTPLKTKEVASPNLKFSSNLICLAQEPGLCAYAGVDDKKSMSVYTKFLLKYLRKKNRNIEHLLKCIKKDVLVETRNHSYVMNPWYQSDLSDDYIWNRTKEFEGKSELECLRNLVMKLEGEIQVLKRENEKLKNNS